LETGKEIEFQSVSYVIGGDRALGSKTTSQRCSSCYIVQAIRLH
jgi:hypothetical protein